MTEAEWVRVVYPRYAAMKELARLLNAPLDTARNWLFRKCSLGAERRKELARRLLREMERQDIPREALRRQLQDIAYGEGITGMADPCARQMGTHTTWRVLASDETGQALAMGAWAFEDAQAIGLLLRLINAGSGNGISESEAKGLVV